MHKVVYIPPREANKISREPMLAVSRHQDDPFPRGVHDTRCVAISVEEQHFWLWFRIPLFLSTWSLCHLFRSLRSNGGSFCFCPTVGLWLVLTTCRTRPMWGSSCCALTVSTMFTWWQPICDGVSIWWSSLLSSVRAINQIESPLDNVWIPRLRTASSQELPSLYNYPCSSWSRQVS